MLVPIYGFVQGDSMGVVVLVHDTDTVDVLAQTLAQACEMRVAPIPGARVFKGGEPLDGSLTLAEAGMDALTRVDLRSPE
jgi:hypothetical protein